MDITLPDDDRAGLDERVFFQRLVLYYDSLAVAIVAVVVNSFALGYLLWTPDNQVVLGSWCAITLLIAAFRISTVVRFRRQSDPERQRSSASWYRTMLFSTVASGLVWGSSGYLFYDTSSTFSQSLLAFVIAGMCAGSIVSLSAFTEASAIFLSMSLLPFMLRLLGVGTRESSVMAAMVLLYLVMMVIFARRANATVISGLEMTYLRTRAEETIERQAFFDELTGLPNRRLLRDRLATCLSRSHRSGAHAALLFLDLDFFKRVNDSFGHSVGDLLLEQVARRLQQLLRDHDTAARLGGDEFVALLTDLDGSVEQVVSLVRRRGDELREAIERPMHIGGNEIHVTVSIGISLLPSDTDNADDLLRHADTAMYRAKDDGRNTLKFFVNEMQETLSRRMAMEQQLRSAMDTGGELTLYLQPQYDRDIRMCGAELLLRWKRDGVFIPPDAFIPVAEDCGLIYRLGDWVMEEACRMGALLLEDIGDRDFSLAFNVSPRQFRKKGFAEKLLATIAAHELPAGLMELELTESLLIDDVEDAAARMHLLRASGLRFSIDDFGTGYSSLRYLKSLPLDTLKVDQSFVRDVLEDAGDASIVRAIVSMAKTLDLEVIAEGVETQQIHDFLVDAGCPRFQGYLYSKPVQLDELRRLLSEPVPTRGD